MKHSIKLLAVCTALILFSGTACSQDLPPSDMTPEKRELKSEAPESNVVPAPPVKPQLPDTRVLPEAKQEELRKAEEKAYQPAVVVYPPDSRKDPDTRKTEKDD